jgi:hypothetical protein
MNEQELIAFELGYDTAMHGQFVPEDAPGFFCDGYRTGRRQYPHPQRTNRYILKWLQIRMNALRRGKRVDAQITPEFIEQIDVEQCPITLEPLTHSTSTDSDWSIDRCNNLRGYVPGNLVIMSTRANAAKSDLTFAQIIANGKSAEPIEGLLPEDWQRMASVIAPAERLADGEPPAQYLLGETYVPGQPYGLPAQIQATLLAAIIARRDTGKMNPIADRVYAEPSFELGVGDDHTTLKATAALHYRLNPLKRVRPYFGGGITAALDYHDPDNHGSDTDFDLSLRALGGVAWVLKSERQFFIEGAVIFGNPHDYQVVAGWRF